MRYFFEKAGLFILALFAGDSAKSQIWVEQEENDNPFLSFDLSDRAKPSGFDVDNDGDHDIVSGACGNSELAFLRNDGPGTYTEIQGIENPFSNTIPCGKPEFVDIDQDGDMDLFIGEHTYDKYASLILYENDGSGNFTETTNHPFSSFEFYYVANISFSDIDDDGDLDALIGDYDSVSHFENDGLGNFTEISIGSSPFSSTANLEYAAPEFADIDMDGDEDVVFGNKYGDLIVFEKTGPGQFIELTGTNNPLANVMNYIEPVPHFFDFDADGDMDLLIGDAQGNLDFFLNTTIAANIEDLEQENIKVYPNPSSDFIRIDGIENIKYANVHSLDGKLVMSKPFFNSDYLIDVNPIETGNYILMIYTEDKVLNTKFSKF